MQRIFRSWSIKALFNEKPRAFSSAKFIAEITLRSAESMFGLIASHFSNGLTVAASGLKAHGACIAPATFDSQLVKFADNLLLGFMIASMAKHLLREQDT